MNCEFVTNRIGAFVDGELASDESRAVEEHLKQCRSCAAEWAALRELQERLVRADPAAGRVAAPRGIWSGIKDRLDTVDRRARWAFPSALRRPLAAAASLALFIGLGTVIAFFVAYSPPAAQATTIDYSILMDGVNEDVEKAIQRFLDHYDARAIPAEAAENSAPRLSFKVPPSLPDDYRLDRVYRLKFGASPGVAAIYHRHDEVLMVFFHPTLDNARVSNPKEMPCIVGEHHGGEIEVGPWRLMHFMDETTCHCVLTKLGDDSELPRIVEIIAPDLKPGVPHHH